MGGGNYKLQPLDGAIKLRLWELLVDQAPGTQNILYMSYSLKFRTFEFSGCRVINKALKQALKADFLLVC